MSDPGEVTSTAAAALMSRRFRGFLPVVIDVETGGFVSRTDALLEIAAVFIDMDASGTLARGATHSFHVQPFPGARMDPASLSVTGIDPYHPLRPALPEREALQRIFREVRQQLRAYDCRRAILVGHNAAFDLGFLNAALERTDVKRSPFHPFSCFDTATLAGAALGDRTRQGCGCLRRAVGRELRALGRVRRRAYGRCVLFCLQPNADDLCGGSRAGQSAGMVRRCRG
jgi:ribonuclease T